MYGLKPEIGDRVTYAPFGGGVRVVLVDEVSDDIKNGRPGFGGENGWGYNDQIIVIAKSKNLEGGK